MQVVRLSAGIVFLALCMACGDDDVPATPDAGAPDAGGAPETPQTLTHAFPPLHAEPGEEVFWQCQSWTLNNDRPLYVNAVRATNGGGWHHSNWFYVTETAFRGEDGTWYCDDRGFDEIGAGLSGGVFFAQSTQSPTDVQQFPPGVAYRIPPHARIVGDVHLINATGAPIDTAITFEIDTIPEADVHTVLTPMSFTNIALQIPPRADSEFRMDCAIAPEHERQLGRPPDFNMYYVLPHYHELGTMLRLELIGGARDGEVIYESRAATGEPWGMTVTPPINVSGAEGIRLTCAYTNPRDQWVRYGIGDQEMCVFLAFTDSPLRYVAYANSNTMVGTSADGTQLNDSPCNLVAAAPF